MNTKLFKKLREKEDKLLDVIEEIKILLEDTEDEELASMGDSFSEIMLDFLYDNDSISLNDIKNTLEQS